MTVVSNDGRDAYGPNGFVTKEPIFFLWLEAFGVRHVNALRNKIVVNKTLIRIVS